MAKLSLTRILFVFSLWVLLTPKITTAQEALIDTYVPGLNLSTKNQQAKSIAVKVRVEIKSKKFESYRTVSIVPGSTVGSVLAGISDVQLGKVCSSENDIWSINGIPTVKDESFWVIKVNGNSQNYSSQSRLFEGDVLELEYLTKKEYENHKFLEEWINE